MEVRFMPFFPDTLGVYPNLLRTIGIRVWIWNSVLSFHPPDYGLRLSDVPMPRTEQLVISLC